LEVANVRYWPKADVNTARMKTELLIMGTWKINLNKQTATSINGITFKLIETKPEEYEGVCLNPSQIPPDDLDDVILGRMIKEAGMFYKMELEGKE